MSKHSYTIDVTSNRLLESFTSTRASKPDNLVFGDAAQVSVQLVEPNDNNSEWPWKHVDLTGQTIRVGVGSLSDATPSAYIELTDDLATPSATVTVIREGVLNTTNELVRVQIDDAYSGTYTLTVAGETTNPICLSGPLDTIADEIEGLASITADSVWVTGTATDYNIEFASSLDDIGAITVTVDALRGYEGKTGTLDLHVEEILTLLDGETEIEATLEVVRWTTADVAGETVLQVPVMVRQDVIPDTLPGTTPLPGYATINLDQINQSGATDGQVAAWNDTSGAWEPSAAGAGTGDLVSTNNLSDVGDAATSLSNLGGAALVHTHTSDEITNNTSESTGVLTGGVLSTGAGAAEFSISDGTGQIVDAAGAVTAVSFSGLSNITPTNIATNLLTWVGINSGGSLVEKVTAFTPNEVRNTVVLGVIVHTDNVTVQAVNNQQVVTYQPLSSTVDVANAIGFVNISGNQFTANGATMTTAKSAGVLFKFGANYDSDTANPHNKTLAALTPVTFEYRYSDGSSQAPTLTTIDPDNLDDGAGGNTAVGNNRWSIQRIYSFVSNNVKIQRGVEDFATKAAAIEGIASEAYITEPSIAANGLLRGWIVLKKGATDLSDPAEAQFINAPKFGESSAGGASTPPGDASVILIEALKATAGTIPAGSVIRTTGYNGTRVLVELADADAAGELPALGITREAITDAIAGNVVVFGKLEGIDTSTFSAADTLYISATPGELTNTRPTGATTGIQAIARVLDVDATNGIVEVVGAGRVNALPQMGVDTFWYGDGTGTPAEGTITTAGRALLDDADADAQRDTLSITDTLGFACSDETTALTTGQKIAIDMPHDMVVESVYASLVTAGTVSSITLDVEDEGVSILNAVLTLTAGSTNAETSTFAAAASSYTLTKGDLLTIDIDSVDSGGTGAGLKVVLVGDIT